MAGLRRLIGGGPRGEAGDAHAAAAAAAARAEATAETGVALGLAAFAVSAFVKSVLCPALSAYTPRVSTVSRTCLLSVGASARLRCRFMVSQE